MNTTTNTLEVAQTIAQQIGGRAFFMMGTQFKTGDEKSLSFNIRGSRMANRVTVTLDGSDTYTVHFCKLRAGQIKAGVTVCGVYADSLKTTIEIHTGLALSF